MKWLLAALLIVNGAVFTWIVAVDRKQQQVDKTAAFNDQIHPAYKLRLVDESEDTTVHDAGSATQKSPQAPVNTATQPVAADAKTTTQNTAAIESDKTEAVKQSPEKEAAAATPTLEDVAALQEQLATLARLVEKQQSTAKADKSTTIKAAPVFSRETKQDESAKQQAATAPAKQETRKQEPARQKTPESPPMTVSFAPQNCFTLGPFEESVDRDRVADLLLGVEIKTTIRTTSQRRTSGYWVYLPPFANRQQARDMLAVLKEKGVSDFLIIPRGEKKNAISLGLFKGRETAQRRIRQLAKIGISAQFKENQTTSKFFWLDFASPHEDPLPRAVKDKILTKKGGIGVLNRPCS